jgi:hypothetical protein
MPSAELHYQHQDDGLVRCIARKPFTVDGIDYHRHSASGVIRPMIQLLPNVTDPRQHDLAEHYLTDPPTDTELNQYLWHGTLPST